MKYLAAFLTSSLAGATIALLLAPEKGEDLRDQIRKAVKKCGCRRQEEIDQLVEEIAAEIQAEK